MADQEQVLWSFCSQAGCADGSSPQAGLIMDGAEHLFGTTFFQGGAGGTVFELTPNAARTKWTETVLHSFCADEVEGVCIDGYALKAGLIMDKTGHLYGTTSAGGANGGGAAFELTPNAARTEWTETALHSFCSKGGGGCTDGESPLAGLIMDKTGHLYGTTSEGGAHGGGTVFELKP